MAEYRFEDIAINSTEKKKPVESDKEHYLGLEHLDSGTFKVSRFGSEVAPIGDKLIMKKGDVLFGKRRAYQKKVAIAPFDGIFSAHGMVLRPKEDVIDKDFFPLFIASDYFLDAAIKISVGSLSPTINWRDLKELKFNLPELDEQKKLAEVLWQIVDTMESYKKLLAKTDEMLKAKFVEMFGTIEKTKFKVVNLEEICEFIKDGTHQTPTYIDDKINGYKFLSSKDVITKKIDWTSVMYIPENLHIELSKRVTPQKGDILLAKNGTTGIAAIVDTDTIFDIYVSLALLRIKPGNNIQFIWAEINHPQTKKQFDSRLKGIGVPNLHLGEIKQTKIILPPIELQNQFADFVQKSEESKAAIQALLDSLSAVYKKIIAENLGGK